MGDTRGQGPEWDSRYCLSTYREGEHRTQPMLYAPRPLRSTGVNSTAEVGYADTSGKFIVISQRVQAEV